ncbi:hypothetical protein LTR16_000808, partial [Cryomyces antarcticus]
MTWPRRRQQGTLHITVSEERVAQLRSDDSLQLSPATAAALSLGVTVEVEAPSTSFSPSISPRTHSVEVGAQGDLIFAPNQLEAAVGDIVNFRFLKLNHTLTQSSLDKPCTAVNGFDTSFVHLNPYNRTNDILSFMVQSTNPAWFFCRQSIPKSHCNAGMVFAINPGNLMDTFLYNSETPELAHRNDGKEVSTASAGSSSGIISNRNPPLSTGLSGTGSLNWSFSMTAPGPRLFPTGSSIR